MQDILSEKVHVPPEVVVLKVQVELGFFGTGGNINPPPSGGDDPLYDFGTIVQDMPGASL